MPFAGLANPGYLSVSASVSATLRVDGRYENAALEAMRQLEEDLRRRKVVPVGVPHLFVDPRSLERRWPLVYWAWQGAAGQAVKAVFDIYLAQLLVVAVLDQMQRGIQ